MPKHNILVVAVDGLRATALGAYGNTAFATPTLDRFAAESFLLDSCFAPAVDLPALYRALWRSLHPLRPAVADHSGPTLPQILSTFGYQTTLVTDEPELVLLPAAAHFDHCVQTGTAADAIEQRAESWTQTAMARLFASACDVVDPQPRLQDHAPRLVWLHSRGMYGPWDAPLELQQMLLEEGDPPPVEDVRPPDLRLADTDDPDATFRYSCAYAAQVMALDACWNGLMEAARSANDEWLVMLIGVRGYPLGEHRRVGGIDDRLYAEQLHVPWLIRFANGYGKLARSGALTSHLDLLPTLLERLELDSPQEHPALDGMSLLPLATTARAAWHATLLSTSEASQAIRTAAWCLRRDTPVAPSSSEPMTGELYVRPDDRWEANDVAKLCRDVVESLTQVIDDISQRARQNLPLPMNVVAGEPTAGPP